MMDDALLRPGRLEVQIEIGLPKVKNRLVYFDLFSIDIFKINMYENYNKRVEIYYLYSIMNNITKAHVTISHNETYPTKHERMIYFEY